MATKRFVPAGYLWWPEATKRVAQALFGAERQEHLLTAEENELLAAHESAIQRVRDWPSWEGIPNEVMELTWETDQIRSIRARLAAQERIERQAADRLRQLAYQSNSLTAVLSERSGEVVPMLGTLWGTDAADKLFENGSDRWKGIGSPFKDTEGYSIQGPVLVHDQELSAILIGAPATIATVLPAIGAGLEESSDKIADLAAPAQADGRRRGRKSSPEADQRLRSKIEWVLSRAAELDRARGGNTAIRHLARLVAFPDFTKIPRPERPPYAVDTIRGILSNWHSAMPRLGIESPFANRSD